MRLLAGKRIAWPTEAFKAERPDLLAAIEDVIVFRIPADFYLPGFPIEIIQRLSLSLSSRLIPSAVCLQRDIYKF